VAGIIDRNPQMARSRATCRWDFPPDLSWIVNAKAQERLDLPPALLEIADEVIE